MREPNRHLIGSQFGTLYFAGPMRSRQSSIGDDYFGLTILAEWLFYRGSYKS